MLVSLILSIAFTIVSVLDLIFKIIQLGEDFLYNVYSYVCLLSILYWGYLLIFNLSLKNAAPGARAGMIEAKKSNFVLVHVYRYLTAVTFGVLFIFNIVNLLLGGFEDDDFFYFIDLFLMGLFMPIGLIVDCFVTPRDRRPNFKCDIIFLFIFLVFFGILYMIFGVSGGGVGNAFKYLGLVFMQIFFTFDGYLFIDYLLYKTNDNTGYYALFKPPKKENEGPKV